mgnify:CR=1 FL=1|tara:strand:- start:19673 stop:20245 length:573 start_codon:yes stop_codon:yes gene_type:complete
MLPTKELLELRKQIKDKKPDFIRQDTHKKKRLERRWKRPTGLHSKIRLKLKGRARGVSQGYRSPKSVRGLYKTGLVQSKISSLKDMERLDSKQSCIIISSSLGNKKRLGILKKAKEKSFVISNIKNTDEFIKKIEEDINSRKKKKDELKNKKKDVKEEKKEGKLTEKVSDDGKKEAEKKEKDKVLTKKGR